MAIYFVTVYLVSLALSYELRSTHAALLLAEEIWGNREGAKEIQNAITPPAAANIGLLIYFGCLVLVAFGWYRFGWIVGLLTIPALLIGSGINSLLLPRSNSEHYRRITIRSMMRRYADYRKTGDHVRAEAMADLLLDAGYPLPEFVSPSGSGHVTNNP